MKISFGVDTCNLELALEELADILTALGEVRAARNTELALVAAIEAKLPGAAKQIMEIRNEHY